MSSSFHTKLTTPVYWDTPKYWLKIHSVDVHTACEPLRIILDGLPALKGKTILEK